MQTRSPGQRTRGAAVAHRGGAEPGDPVPHRAQRPDGRWTPGCSARWARLWEPTSAVPGCTPAPLTRSDIDL
jgi:hypothetical protein